MSYSGAVNGEVTDVKEEEHVIKGPEESRSPGPALSSVPPPRGLSPEQGAGCLQLCSGEARACDPPPAPATSHRAQPSPSGASSPRPGEFWERGIVGGEQTGVSTDLERWGALSGSRLEIRKEGSPCLAGQHIPEASTAALGEFPRTAPLPEAKGNLGDTHKHCMGSWRPCNTLKLHGRLQHPL